MSDTWLTMTASNLGREIGKGEIDPVDLTDTYLDAIDAHPLSERIYARVTPDRARAEALAARDRAHTGTRASLLDGVPISWKDLFDSACVGTEAGSALLAGRVPDQDARVLAAATRGGTVCLGKTHMSELAFSGLGYNPVTQSPPCVNDPDAVSGGSSSGAATSVAFGLAACGIGSDTGGSVRIPAAWNDLVGLKTTSGRLSLEGVVPLCARLDTVGPLCRSVEDAAQMLTIMEGGKPADLTGASLKGRRFAIPTNVTLDDLEGAPKAAFDSAVERLRAAGALVERVEFPEFEQALAVSVCLFTVEAYGTWGDAIEAQPDVVYHEILERFRAGMDFTGPDFVRDWQTLDRLRASYLQRAAGYDAILTPSSPLLPPNVERLITDHDYYVKVNLLALRNTRLGNLLGLCSLTLPTGVPSCGIMLSAAPMCEEALLRVGAAAELALS